MLFTFTNSFSSFNIIGVSPNDTYIINTSNVLPFSSFIWNESAQTLSLPAASWLVFVRVFDTVNRIYYLRNSSSASITVNAFKQAWYLIGSGNYRFCSLIADDGTAIAGFDDFDASDAKFSAAAFARPAFDFDFGN